MRNKTSSAAQSKQTKANSHLLAETEKCQHIQENKHDIPRIHQLTTTTEPQQLFNFYQNNTTKP